MGSQRGLTTAQLAELGALLLLGCLGAAAAAASAGHFGWSWDALNHHVYLGLTAESPRWHLDVMPANYQTYQVPYLYWPVYRMSLWSGSGAWLASLWAALQAGLVLAPLWWICHRLFTPTAPSALHAAAERMAGCALGAMSIVFWAALTTTANDLLASVPLLWALAVGLGPQDTRARLLAMSGLLGMSVAFKLSNAVFAPLLLLWWWQPKPPHLPLSRAVSLAAGAVLGFAVFYAPWGLQLWRAMGHPFYPFAGT